MDFTNYQKSVDNVYSKLQKCIIIGLTGRTGSGCSTAAEILRTKDFHKLRLPTPQSNNYSDCEQRKYSIVYNYLKNNKWKPFDVIEVSSIILTFAFEKTFDQFIEFIISLIDSEATNISTERLSSELQNNKRLKKCFNQKLDLSDTKKQLDKRYTYFTDTINDHKNCIKQCLRNLSFQPDKDHKAQLYTTILQTMGNNLRSSGDVYNNTYNENSVFTIAERINSIISIIKNYNESKNLDTRICIDAFRNPYEAYYFKDLYKCFYLISVSTDDKDRRIRLNSFSADELDAMDTMEYPTSKECEAFFQQSISDCIQISDIHLYNPNDNNRQVLLKTNLIKYIALMLHPGLITPTHIERCMQTAYNAKCNSGCLSRQVGAIITDDKFYIKAVGWNDVPEGQIPCNLRSIKNYLSDYNNNTFSAFELENNAFRNALQKLNIEFEKYEEKNKETINTPFCFKDVYNSIKGGTNQVYTRALHAEENAFLQITKFGGQGIKGGKLFVTSSPCELCSKKAFQLGIKEIYYIDPYPGIAHSQIIQAGIPDSRPKSQLFYGAIGNAYVSLFMQRFGIKDELQYITGIDIKEFIKNINCI